MFVFTLNFSNISDNQEEEIVISFPPVKKKASDIMKEAFARFGIYIVQNHSLSNVILNIMIIDTNPYYIL